MEVPFPRMIWVVAITFFCAYWCGWPLPAQRLPVGWLYHSTYHAFSSGQGWRPAVLRQNHAFVYAQMSPFQIGEVLWVFWNVCFHRHYLVSSSPILWMGAGEPRRGGWICWATETIRCFSACSVAGEKFGNQGFLSWSWCSCPHPLQSLPPTVRGSDLKRDRLSDSENK